MAKKTNEEKTVFSVGHVILKVFVNLLPMFYAITCIFPVIWLGYTTLKTNPQFAANVLALPKSFYMGNYDYVILHTDMLTYMFNTIRITAVVLILVLAMAFTTGYFLARFEFRFHGLLSVLYISNLFIPFHAILISIYILMVKVKINDHWFATILPAAAMEMTTALFLVRSYVEAIPTEIEEAAAIDGSSFSRTLFTIIMPMVRPILVTIAIIAFFHSWNEFSMSLVAFSKEKLYTMSLAVMQFKGDYLSDYPRVMTVIFTAITPALLIYVFFSKWIIKGMMSGAVKG